MLARRSASLIGLLVDPARVVSDVRGAQSSGLIEGGGVPRSVASASFEAAASTRAQNESFAGSDVAGWICLE